MNLCRAQSSPDTLSRDMHEIGVRVRDSDRELDGGGLVICEGLPRVEVEGRPGRGPVSIDSSSTDFDSVVLRLFLGGQFGSPPTHVFYLKDLE